MNPLKKLFPQLVFRNAAKCFYGKYYVSVTLFDENIFTLYHVKTGWESLHRYSWLVATEPLTQPVVGRFGRTIDAEHLRQLYQWMLGQHTSTPLKMRMEWKECTFYFEDYAQAQRFIDWALKVNPLNQVPNWVRKVTVVDPSLQADEVVLQHPDLAPYNYKVMINSSGNRLDVAERKRLRDLLNNLADDVRLTAEFARQIHDAGWGELRAGMYFYCKSLSTISYLQLCQPDLIKRIYKVRHRPQGQHTPNPARVED